MNAKKIIAGFMAPVLALSMTPFMALSQLESAWAASATSASVPSSGVRQLLNDDYYDGNVSPDPATAPYKITFWTDAPNVVTEGETYNFWMKVERTAAATDYTAVGKTKFSVNSIRSLSFSDGTELTSTTLPALDRFYTYMNGAYQWGKYNYIDTYPAPDSATLFNDSRMFAVANDASGDDLVFHWSATVGDLDDRDYFGQYVNWVTDEDLGQKGSAGSYKYDTYESYLRIDAEKASQGGGNAGFQAVTGKLSMSQHASNDSAVVYDIYKLFDADIENGLTAEGKVRASDIDWFNADAKAAFDAAVIAADLSDEWDAFLDGRPETAQGAAEFIDAHMEMNEVADSKSFCDCLAEEVAKKASLKTDKTITAGGNVTLEDGYYLLVGESDGMLDTAASAPIFVGVGGNNEIEITEKSAIPQIDKQIKEDSTGEFGVVADSTINQAVDYKLTGTVAQNVASYDTYSYQFVDTWDQSQMELVGTPVVKIDGTTVANGYAFVADADESDDVVKMTITFADLKAAKDGEGEPIAITADSEVVVEYQAKLIEGAEIAGDGNKNEAQLFYSNNPQVLSSVGHTKEVSTKDYTYQLKIEKTDYKTGEVLEHAKFTIQNKDGKYLAIEEGKLVESTTPYKFETDEDGLIVIEGVDADVYSITETDAPSADYMTVAGFTATITPTYEDADDNGYAYDLTALAAAFGDGYDATHIVAGVTGDAEFAKLATGLVQMNVKDVKYVDLPITGENGIFLITLAGLALIGGGLIVNQIRRRKMDE